MGIMVYSSLWGMQDFVHQPYETMQPKPCAHIPGAGISKRRPEF